MSDQHILFIALAFAGILILIIYMARKQGHQVHHGGLEIDGHRTMTTTALHMHLHA